MQTRYHNARFPTSISRGASGGPLRQTDIVVLGSGHEERNTRWSASKRKYNAGLGVKTLDEIYQVIAFFEETRGRLYAFRWKDHADYKSSPPLKPVTREDQFIATGDGITSEFQLVKTYGVTHNRYKRTITKPVANSVVMAVGGVELQPDTDFTVDTDTGVITFMPSSIPAAGAAITAGFEFDVPVRFDVDYLEINLVAFHAGQIPEIPIVEVLT